MKTAQELTKNQIKMQAAQAQPAAPAPAVGGGFTAPAGGGGGEGKGKEEKLKEPSGLPGHGGPTGPIDKLHGGMYIQIIDFLIFFLISNFSNISLHFNQYARSLRYYVNTNY